MTDFIISDDLKDTVAEKATDILNSGIINFDVVSADGNSTAAVSLIEVHLGDPSLTTSRVRTHSQ
ncbi:hypothetical protein [Poseidonocella sedimentorum]|uniref:hypothetical protein n=1 Tax=Poseidonocella sedimentorum TaxID=871652 RepID=UPI0011605414|nr:hypothetical protein [Poseidonocella sedimentorum]